MKKIISICFLFIIFVAIIYVPAFAAEQAKMDININKTEVEQGEEIEIKLSITNNSFENGISVVYGTLNYDEETFNMVSLNYDEEIEKANTNNNSLMANILQGFKEQNSELAYVDDNWCIAIIEQQGIKAFTAMTITDTINTSTSNHEIGSIRFKILETAKNQKAKIEFNNLGVSSTSDMDNSVTIENVHTDSITIGGEIEDMEPIQPSNNEKNNESSNTSNNNSQSKNNSEAQTGTPYTGAEDVMPFIIIALIFGIFGFIKYRNYKEI